MNGKHFHSIVNVICSSTHRSKISLLPHNVTQQLVKYLRNGTGMGFQPIQRSPFSQWSVISPQQALKPFPQTHGIKAVYGNN